MRSKVHQITTALFLLAALSFLCCFQFLIPSLAPIKVNNLGDSLLNLAPGQRMYQGEMIYRDVFEFLTPGTALVNFLMFKLFGLRPWIPNLLALLLGLGMAWLGVAISRKLMRTSLALLPSAVFIVSERGFMSDPNHHWYSVLATLAAIAVLLERRTPVRIAAAGMFCGLCACFTQTSGLAVVVGFAAFLWWDSRRRNEDWRGLLRKEAWLLTSFFATFLAVIAYFIFEAGPARFFWCTVVFVLKYHHREAYANTFQVIGTALPTFASVRTFLSPFAHWLFLFVLSPFSFVLFFSRYWRDSRRKPLEYWDRPMLVAIVGFFMFLSIIPAPSDVRMAAIMLPALILLIWFLDSQRKLARAFVAALAAGTFLIAFYSIVERRPDAAGIVKTPHGDLAIIDPTLDQEYLWIQQHTQPREYFYEPSIADHYFYLDLRNPTPISYTQNNGYTTKEQVAEVIQGLEIHQVRYILRGVGEDDAPKSSELENASTDYLGPLRDYIRTHYSMVKVFPNTAEIWEKKPE